MGEAVGAVLTELRVQKGLTMREVARRSNCAIYSIANVERARKSPTLRTLEALARACSVKVSSIIMAAEEAQRAYKERKRKKR
jgi:transcriptional regulator with XRE-family HTH domain